MQVNHSALLASHGFAVLALAYFRYAHLPMELVDIPLEYFEKALAWLGSRTDIRPDTLGVVGFSRGGELALILGAMFPAIRRVVAFVPSDRANPGFRRSGPHLTWEMASPYDSSFWANPLRSENAWNTFLPRAWLWRGQPLAYTTIPVERIQGPVLLISGKADMVWPSSEMCERIVKRLEEHKHPYPFKHLSYAHAGHFISFPYVPTGITEVEHPVTGTIVRLGGTAPANAWASEDSWRQVLKFLESDGGFIPD